MMELHTDKRFHNLTLEQVQTLDQVLTEVIPIHGRGNFPTLEVRPKDIIHVVKDRLMEREILVRDIRLNGSTASHVMLRDNGVGLRDLDIIFGVELPRQEDFQIIKEVVLGSLRDLLPRGVNRRKITCLTMKEAYVQKMVKVFNDHDRWSLISLSNNRGKTVGLRFVSSLRRQFEFSVDSFQIILDRMLESYWEAERRETGGQFEGLELHMDHALGEARGEEKRETETQQLTASRSLKEKDKDNTESPRKIEEATVREEEPSHPTDVCVKQEARDALEMETVGLDLGSLEDDEEVEEVPSEEDAVFELCGGAAMEEMIPFNKNTDNSSVTATATLLTEVMEPLVTNVSLSPQTDTEDLLISKESEDILLPGTSVLQDKAQSNEMLQSMSDVSPSVSQNSTLEHSFPPPAKKTCNSSQEIVPDYCPSPKPPRKMSRKMSSTSSLPEKWSLLKDLSDLTTQLFEPIEIPKTIKSKPPLSDNDPNHYSSQSSSRPKALEGINSLLSPKSHSSVSAREEHAPPIAMEQIIRVKHTKKPPDSETLQELETIPTALNKDVQSKAAGPDPVLPKPEGDSWGPGPEACSSARERPTITVVAECMYGDFEQAMDHLRFRLIATHNPEEIRGGGLLKYSDLLVRSFRPASETEIKSLERYMCSRFFIDFPDVGEQQRKIEAYLRCHFVGDEETSKYDYLMTLRRVIDESTVCLMGHERRQTLNMITVLALRVLGEQNAIPNTANVTCFYQPAPYMADPIFNSYYIPQAQPPLLYHPYPLHVHMQTGLV